jgi:3-oxoacyl-[acyl-carrier protein] reductase
MSKSVLVTGASGMIGRSLVAKFEKEGWQVFAQVRNELVFPNSVETIKFDLSHGSAKDLIAHIPTLDLIINCAANQEVISAEEITNQKALEIFKINTISPFEIIVAAKSIGAKVAINTSSIEGDVARPGHEIYGASKAALDAITRSLANSLAPMRVNGVRLGLIGGTDLAQRWPGGVASWKAAVPAGRYASADEVAEFIYKLSGPEFEYATGAIFDFDGGKRAAPGW